jgi:hypothetical protein
LEVKKKMKWKKRTLLLRKSSRERSRERKAKEEETGSKIAIVDMFDRYIDAGMEYLIGDSLPAGTKWPQLFGKAKKENQSRRKIFFSKKRRRKKSNFGIYFLFFRCGYDSVQKASFLQVSRNNFFFF